MNAAQMMARMTWVEVDAQYPPDFRRLVTDHRISLHVATQKGDGEAIGCAMDSARELFDEWPGRGFSCPYSSSDSSNSGASASIGTAVVRVVDPLNRFTPIVSAPFSPSSAVLIDAP